ncbi:unnamed protein product [Linum tenue]|uniref:Zinc finger CCCH domain-containing protein 44-like n=1 Tax=Linum tenue TaxID=586396 RepID=A0AAV0NU09_9ROSI|nr:unnamed protein product [Linum tenue]
MEQQQQVRRTWIGEGEQSQRRGVFDSLLRGVGAEHMTIDQCEAIREMDDSQLVGVPVVLAKADVSRLDVEVRNAAAATEISKVKRRRGRPPRNQGKPAPPPPPKAMDEEDVCFICFDGGSLVLCDRRGCPKAYHPACIKRDEAFFQSKGKWNCGWHICSNCEKTSHYMCYTCTYSLCKGCTKGADYLCVRGNKGFCGTCKKTIMLIENVPMENSEKVQVDFDDKLSWEYLFKVYWVCLKENLLLTVDEILKAKNPWQVDELHKTKSAWKVPDDVIGPVGESSSEIYYGSNEKASSSGNSYGTLETNYSKRRKTDDKPNIMNEEKSVGMVDKLTVEKVVPLPVGSTEWATKELLEFVAHVKNGDTTFLSQFDVEALLLDYIKRNNLRDPRRKCQILCDTRLINLFGKTRIDHIEMLKLLESHFLVKEIPQRDESQVRVELPSAEDNASCTNLSAGIIGNFPVVSNDRSRKTSNRMDEKETHTTNPNADEFAAIDVHNINLLYLKRSLMENLVNEADKFHEKAVGSFVRIRIPCGDMHRLVQVVGTCKASQAYKLGSRKTDILLEISNLDKKEFVSIDGISDQDFSEEECRRLKLSVESGLVKFMKVGEVQEKATVLHSMKVSDCLEAEISRLNHLRDQASEKRQRKKYPKYSLLECVEKLDILQSFEERKRRLLEVPIVHSDPNIGPLSSSHEQNSRPVAAPCQPTSAVFPPGIPLSPLINEDELERLWHYRDPFGTVQGPFPMMQLQKWSTSGLFPQDLRVWRVHENEQDSVLLTDALLRLVLQKEPPKPANNNCIMLPQEVATAACDSTDKKWSSGSSQDTGTTQMEEDKNDEVDKSGKAEKNDSSARSSDDGNDEITRSTEELASHPSRLTMLVDLVIGNNELSQRVEQQSDVCGSVSLPSSSAKNHNDATAPVRQVELTKNNPKSWVDQQSEICGSVTLPSSDEVYNDAPTPHVGQVEEEENRSSSVNDLKESSPDHKTPPKEEQQTIVESDKVNGTSNSEGGCSSQSSRQSWQQSRHMNITIGWDLNSTFPSISNSTETVKLEHEIIFADLQSPLPKQQQGDNGDLKGGQSGREESKHSTTVSCNVPIIDAGPCWSTTSSLVGGTRLPGAATEWTMGYSSPAIAKSSVEDWGSNLVPEPNEFSLVDESVSDLLAEVEAMESLGGLPSPTSKLSCGVDLMQVSDNDCFSPVEDFSPAAVPDHGRSDALSSTGGGDIMQMPSRLSSLAGEQQLGLSIMSSPQPIAHHDDEKEPYSRTTTHHKPPPQLITVTDHKPPPVHNISLMLSLPPVTSDSLPLGLPTTPLIQPHHSPVVGRTIGLSQTDARKRSPSGHSSSRSKLERRWEGSSETKQVQQSSFKQTKPILDIKLPPASTASCQVEVGSDTIHCPVPAGVDLRLGNSRGRSILGLVPGAASSHSNGSVQKHGGALSPTSTGHSTTSTGNPPPSPLGSQTRDRHSGGSRDHRSSHRHHSGRDSGGHVGRDRSTSAGGNNRQGSTGGGSFRSPPKGSRVLCRYIGSGKCKKGAACSFWHP